MTKRVQIGLVILFVAIVVGMIDWLVLRTREPAYHEKSLSVWLREAYEPGRVNPEIETAIRQIGTNALPRLLSLVKAKDSAFKRTLLTLLRRQSLIVIRMQSEEERHGMAMAGFQVLGPTAKPAVPALINLLNDGEDFDVRSSAAFCLGAIGPTAQEAVPELTHCLSNAISVPYSGYGGVGFLKERAATALGFMGPAAQPAIPILILATNDERWYVRNAAQATLMRLRGESVLPLIEELKDTSDPIRWYERAMLVSDFRTNAEPAIPYLIDALGTSNDIILGHAALALGKIRREASVCVPALISLLSSPSVSTRQKSLYALGEFAAAAREAVPAITRCLGDSDSWVRMEATNILLAIAPAAVTKAGVK
jgi:HEAT repeat protein